VTVAAAGAGGAPVTVPYITQWSAEDFSPVWLVQRRRGIAYADERPGDRDKHGVLWARVSSLPGQGRPPYGKLHARRQRKAITKLLCLICGRKADRNRDGLLWLVGEDPDGGQRPRAPQRVGSRN
jgi:hypothetical protein